MLLVVPANSTINQSVSHLATNPPFTCPNDFFNPLQCFLAQDPTGQVSEPDNRSLFSEVDNCAPMPIMQSVVAAALPSFQSLGQQKPPLTPTEFLDQLSVQRDADGLIRFIRNNNNVLIPNNIKISIILGKFSKHHISSQAVHDLIKNLKPKISFNNLVQLIEKYGFTEDFLKNLHKAGVPSKLFNIPDTKGRTILQKLAGRGYVELVNQIAKDIPKDRIVMTSDVSFKEEMEDCFVQSKEVDLSRFDPTKTMIAQNGCRAVIMTHEGEIHSYPGQDASKLAQQLAQGTSLDSFTIYHNRGHASIAFSDAHFGFYPQAAFDDIVAQEVGGRSSVASSGQSSIMTGSALAIQPGSSSLPNSYKSKIAGGVLLNIRNKNIPSAFVPCKVFDDWKEKNVSENGNDLTLRVYAPKGMVKAVRQYVKKIQTACKAGTASAAYHALKNNCIEFVRQAVQASGTKADFRDSFHTMQYLRRPGSANFLTMLRSKKPLIHTNSSLVHSRSIPEIVDRVARNAVVGGLMIIPGVPYFYMVDWAIPKTKAAIALAGSRIMQAAALIPGILQKRKNSKK